MHDPLLPCAILWEAVLLEGTQHFLAEWACSGQSQLIYGFSIDCPTMGSALLRIGLTYGSCLSSSLSGVRISCHPTLMALDSGIHAVQRDSGYKGLSRRFNLSGVWDSL